MQGVSGSNPLRSTIFPGVSQVSGVTNLIDRSSENGGYRFAFVRDFERPLRRGHDDFLVIESERMGDGGVEVLNGDQTFLDLAATGVREAVFHAAFDAAARQGAGEGGGMVVAAAIVLGFDLRSTAELGGDDHQGVLEFSALLQIG